MLPILETTRGADHLKTLQVKLRPTYLNFRPGGSSYWNIDGGIVEGICILSKNTDVADYVRHSRRLTKYCQSTGNK